MNGVRIAWRDPRIMVLLLMVAAVTVAADPILVLGPALAHSFGDSADWSGIFIAALGAGNVIGSFLPRSQQASIRRAALALCVLSIAMMIFVLAHVIWLSVAAALVAGMACLLAGATLKTLLLHHAGEGVGHQASVMAAWALAWAGSKPIAALADGLLVSRLRGTQHRRPACPAGASTRVRAGSVPGVRKTTRPPRCFRASHLTQGGL